MTGFREFRLGRPEKMQYREACHWWPFCMMSTTWLIGDLSEAKGERVY